MGKRKQLMSSICASFERMFRNNFAENVGSSMHVGFLLFTARDIAVSCFFEGYCFQGGHS